MFKFNQFAKQSLLTQSKFFKANKFGFKQFVKDRLGLDMSLKSTSSKSSLGYVLFGISLGGFGLLGYNSYKSEAAYQKQLGYAPSYGKSIANERVKSTLLYFAGSLASTSAMVALMMRRPGIIGMSMSMWSLLVTIPGLVICGYGARSTPNDTPANKTRKHLFWLGMNALMAFSITPLIAFSELKLVGDAFLLTSGCFGGLAITAYNSHDSAYLGMSGVLGAGLGCLMAVSIANLFFQSHAMFNLWLYGGLALFLGMTLYDLKNIEVRARREMYFDPMDESIKVYYDFINIFIRLLYILQNRKNNK